MGEWLSSYAQWRTAIARWQSDTTALERRRNEIADRLSVLERDLGPLRQAQLKTPGEWFAELGIEPLPLPQGGHGTVPRSEYARQLGDARHRRVYLETVDKALEQRRVDKQPEWQIGARAWTFTLASVLGTPLAFLLPWGTVRLVGWIVEGFRQGRPSGRAGL